MRILALDLGKRKSVACFYEGASDEAAYRSVQTDPASLHDLVVELGPDRVVFEICPTAGWLADLVRYAKRSCSYLGSIMLAYSLLW